MRVVRNRSQKNIFNVCAVYLMLDTMAETYYGDESKATPVVSGSNTHLAVRARVAE